MLRVARGLNGIRNRINPTVLRRLLQGYIQAQVQAAVKDELLGFLDEVGIHQGSVLPNVYSFASIFANSINLCRLCPPTEG